MITDKEISTIFYPYELVFLKGEEEKPVHLSEQQVNDFFYAYNNSRHGEFIKIPGSDRRIRVGAVKSYRKTLETDEQKL